MELTFEKWHGCRNDFAVMRITDADGEIVINSLRRLAPRLCDRHQGIGADGLLVLWCQYKDHPWPHRLSIINADGSLAQNCGNGLRCAAASVLKAHEDRGGREARPEALEFAVEGESKICRFLRLERGQPTVSVAMGVPIINEDLSWWSAAQAEVKRVTESLGLKGVIEEIAACELGNKHLVLSAPGQACRELLLRLGPALQKSPHWDGINVHLVEPRTLSDGDQSQAMNTLGQRVSELYQAYVWERGAGETQACGSGATAIGAQALASGLAERDSWIGVDMPGGRLYVKHEDAEESAVLAGPAVYVYKGTVLI